MALTLITGPVNSGKTTHLLEILREALASGPAFYVVPNDALANELKGAFLRHKKNGALIDGVFASYSNFVRRAASSAKTPITAHQQALLCMKILSGQRLKYFRRDRISFGIAREAAETITTLKRNLITADTLASMLETRGTLKEFDLQILFKTYEIEKSRLGAIDRGDLHITAAEKISEGAVPFLKGAREIIFDEFFAPEPGVLEIVRLLKKSNSVILSLPEANHSSELFAASARNSIEEFAKISDKHIKFPARKNPEPTAAVLKAHSPLKEIRLLVEQARGESGDRAVDTVLCARKNDSCRDSFVREVRREDRNASLPAAMKPDGAPVVAALLEGKSASLLPRKASIEKFSELLSKEPHNLKPDEGWKDSLKAPRDRAPAARSFAAVKLLDSTLNSLSANAKYLKTGDVAREIFLEMVSELIGLEPPPHADQGALPLRLAVFENGTSVACKKLLMPGMAEGRYPSISDERLFFTDQEELGPKPNRTLDAIFPSAEMRLARESFLFATWIAKAADEVIFTLPAVDEDGGETVRSSFIDSFGDALSVETSIPRPAAAEKSGFADKIAKGLEIEEERMAGKELTAGFHAVLADKKAREMIRRRYTAAAFSASQLETYAECPFIFFLERVLGLKPQEEVTKEIQPKDRGTIIHTILERFYAGHIGLFRRAAHDEEKVKEIEARIEMLSEEAFKEHAALISQSSPVIHPFQKKAIKTVVRHVIMKELADARKLPSPLYPAHCEWAFGVTADGALKIEIGGDSPAFIQGRVDRIDVSEDGRFFAVTDYKTGKTIKTIASELEEGTHLQLPLYVNAVKRLLLRDAVPLGGFLLAVMTAEKKYGFLKKEFNEVNYSIGKRISSLFDEEKWDNILDTALDHASKYISQIRNGKFSPAKDGCPNHCTYGDVCRSGKA